MDSLVQHEGVNQYVTKMVWFQGTTQLRDGQALCYQELLSDITKGLGIDVEVPNAQNINYFAGWVQKVPGTVGPCWVRIITPRRGDVLQIEVDGTTDIAVDDKLTIQSTSGLEGFAKDASPAYTDHPILTAREAYTTNSLGLKKVFVDQA